MQEKHLSLNTIKSIPQLIQQLSQNSKLHYSTILKKTAIPLSDFSPFTSWNKTSYTRNCMVRNSDFELILLCWEKGQHTAIHSHNGQDCWVFPISGKIKEYRYKIEKDHPEIIEGNILTGLSFINDKLYQHSLHNVGNGRAVTLHLYAKPINHCTYYDSEDKAFKTKELYCTEKLVVVNN